MPNSRHMSDLLSPSSRRPTKRRRSSITELAFHGINTSRQKSEKCYPCVRYEVSPMSQAAHKLRLGEPHVKRSQFVVPAQAGPVAVRYRETAAYGSRASRVLARDDSDEDIAHYLHIA